MSSSAVSAVVSRGGWDPEAAKASLKKAAHEKIYQAAPYAALGACVEVDPITWTTF